ncbi:HNH endonuclease [Glutamicibacter protophormiae]|uniref:HNH endonuclease n=1 Tax=Glutamicibacter protophormiae TaxID=37930 RepID=UPI00195834A4|nr:HNH endonuclease signature motif containing protein [Glutamicibacter protophormiae]QRQ77976.1 DUF222 domain-containing protein [Glutamicibacter protophormiae]QRQ79079.1 DUF222 domain-containing protein [Glutamicibacter protophormiae]
MFDSYEVEQDYFEVTPWQAGTFEQNPCLDPWDATFINTALASTDPALQLRVLEQCERFKSFYSSIQARAAARLDALTGTTPEHHPLSIERGTAHAIALARHQTPQGSLVYLRRIRNLIPDMPYLFSRFEHGHLGEDMILAIMTPLDDSTTAERTEFDRFYQQHPDLFDGASTTQAKDTAQKAVDLMRETPRTEELEHATAERYLRIRKGKDCIHINGKVSPEIGLALDDFLTREVNKALAAGDPRSRSQLRADLFTRAITGHQLDEPLPITLHVNLVMTDRALFLRTPDTASLPGYGSIPAEYARQLIADLQATAGTTPPQHIQENFSARVHAYPMFRRLFMAPNSQDLVTMDSRERSYQGQLRHLIQLRDQFCRTPYCTNKPEHLDHVQQAAKGGRTSFSNGAFKCASCNLAKEAPGWEEEVESSAPHRIRIRPTSGVEYVSSSPPTTGMGRLNRMLYHGEHLIPPVPVKYPPPDPDGITIY